VTNSGPRRPRGSRPHRLSRFTRLAHRTRGSAARNYRQFREDVANGRSRADLRSKTRLAARRQALLRLVREAKETRLTCDPERRSVSLIDFEHHSSLYTPVPSEPNGDEFTVL